MSLARPGPADTDDLAASLATLSLLPPAALSPRPDPEIPVTNEATAETAAPRALHAADLGPHLAGGTGGSSSLA